WSQWTTAWTGQSGQVDYQLEFPSKNCGCGWKFVRIRHTLPYRAFVSIWLEGVDCDGKTMTSSFDSETMGGEISSDQGDWHSFKSVSGVAKVEIQYEDGDKRVKIITTRSGTTRYINGMSEKAYNQQQQEKAAASMPPANKPSSGTKNPSSSNTTKTNQTISSESVSQKQVQLDQQQRLQREEAYRKQQEAERRQREEAFRQNELRYQAQLQEITRKSEARAQRDAAIMDGFAGFISTLQKNKAEQRLNEDASKRSSKLSEYERKLKEGDYQLINCKHCNLDGYDRCGQCKNKGTIKCSSCNGEAGKRCSSCSGTGKTGYGPYQVACFDCSGTGERKCLPCGNEGSNICFLCRGRGEVQCGHCEGTGKMLERVSTQSVSTYSSSSTTTSYQTSSNFNRTLSIAEEEVADNKAKALVVTIRQGQEFLGKNKMKPGVKSTTSGLQYQVLKVGSGRSFKPGDTISYHERYSDIQGNLLYDSYQYKQQPGHALSRHSMGLEFSVEAFSMMQSGSRYKFFIPHNLAYKERGALLPNGKMIQPGSTLIIEYELLSVSRPVEEMLKEEFALDSILNEALENDLTMTLTDFKADSVFGIAITRSYKEEDRMQINVQRHTLYREEDGYYPLDAYRRKIQYNQQIKGSVSTLYYIPTIEAYQKIIYELKARAKKEGMRVNQISQVNYLNKKPIKKQSDFTTSQSQSIDAEWRAKYDSCRILYDQERYFDCYQLAQSLSEQMGRKNQKVQTLLVFSGYLSIVNWKRDGFLNGSSPNHPMNYKNLSLLNSQAKDLLSLATPADSAARWLSAARVYEEDTRLMAEDYIYQKDRTPEKAVSFLNKCEDKFEKKPLYGSEGSTYAFFLIKDSILEIISFVSEEWGSKRIKDKYYFGCVRINLKDVYIDKRMINRSKEKIHSSYLFVELPAIYNSSEFKIDTLPILTNSKNQPAMFLALGEDNNEDRAFKKMLKAKENPLPYLNIFHIFNENDPRFTEEEYDKKILETFQYLIDYFKN
ncbi:MAG: FKBP-type peptidyl-prolyl cis-trans isomerase N-terminal domain-containing protein, partial [Bacteroidota bacterium]